MTNDALPPLTEIEKQRAFEWLRDEAMHIRHAYVALRAWAELKAAQSSSTQPELSAAIERERLANMRADQAEEARDAAVSATPAIPEDALRYAREFVADPDKRAQVKFDLANNGWPKLAAMIDEAVTVSRALLALDGAAKREGQ